MRTSQFQFSNPMLSSIQFNVNDTYEANDAEVCMNINIDIKKERIAEREAIVELTLEIGENNENAPFYVKAVEGATFKWEEGAFEKEQEIEKLLDVNAPALLLSYLRPIISNVTTMSKYLAYHVPFVNFNSAGMGDSESKQCLFGTYDGIGKPEPLKGNLRVVGGAVGLMIQTESCIAKKDGAIIIASVKGHYEEQLMRQNQCIKSTGFIVKYNGICGHG